MFGTMKGCLGSFFVLFVSAMAFAQGGVATGDVHVIVKDPGGNVVTSATVTVRDIGKGVERTANSDGQGGYDARLLPPGTYTVSVQASGFNKVDNTGVAVTVGALVELPVSLKVAGGQEVIDVPAQPNTVQTEVSAITDTVGQRRIDNLPIDGRGYLEFAKLNSQVGPDTSPSLGGAAPTSGMSSGGQRPRGNEVNVDGMDATDNSVNGVRSTLSQEGVQEFEIILNSYAAEYGRASGSVINIVTKSGTNGFHGDVFGFLRNRSFQAVNPFSTVKNPAYTRVQAGAAFGGPIQKNKTYYFFSYEITRRHETGFSSIGQDGFGLSPIDASAFFGAPPGSVNLQLTGDQINFLANPAVDSTVQTNPGYAFEVGQYLGLVGASSGMAVNREWPVGLTGGNPGVTGFPTTCSSPPCPIPTSFQGLASQAGNFPVFEGTSLYSLRLDHNIGTTHRLSFRASVSPSTVTGIEVSGEDQPLGQNAYSRTSQTTYRDVTGAFQDSWNISNSKINEFRFQYARRGYSYFYNTQIPSGSDPAVNITGFAYIGREPYSYIQRTEQRYQFTDNFSWSKGPHNTKFGFDFNYLPLSATFTVNYGGVYDFGSFSAKTLGFVNPAPGSLPNFPDLNSVQAYGAGLPGSYVQGLGSPSDSFHNIPIGAFWQDTWRVNSHITLNYGVRYDVEIPPSFKPPQGLALAAYNTLGLQKGIQADKNNIQPRFGVAWDPKGDKKTVVRASYGMFYDHPLLGLYFLGDASDGSSSGQLAFAGTGGCSFNSLNPAAGNPANLNAIPIFQGLPINAPPSGPGGICAVSGNPAVASALGYLPNQQQFQSLNFPQSIFLNQNYLNPSTFLPLGFQPFGYPQGKNFVYAYSQQANLSVERDLGKGFALNLAYNFNGGRHLNRPINANTIRGDLMVANFEAALADGQSVASPFTVSGCNPAGGPLGPFPFVDASLMNFFRPGGINPSIIGAYAAIGDPLGCINQAATLAQTLGFHACDPATFNGCVPFGDMDANYSNGSSVYHGFSANLRKSTRHYEFLASYTWSHAIDDSTDLQSTLTPQDSYYPAIDRATSLFDARHRFVFSGVYDTGKLGNGFARKFLSDWTFAPLLSIASGHPFNILTGGGDNLQLSALTSRPNTTVDPACGTAYRSKYSPSGTFQEPCINGFVLTGTVPTLLQLDGNLGRNAGRTPWTAFGDMRVSKSVFITERLNAEFIVDMFNIANKYNVAAVSPLFTNAGLPTAAYNPRQFQFAMKVKW